MVQNPAKNQLLKKQFKNLETRKKCFRNDPIFSRKKLKPKLPLPENMEQKTKDVSHCIIEYAVCLYLLFFIVVALQALKRKKRFEKQLTQIDGALSTIEFQREALENAKTNTAVLQSMKTAAKALKSAHQDL